MMGDGRRVRERVACTGAEEEGGEGEVGGAAGESSNEPKPRLCPVSSAGAPPPPPGIVAAVAMTMTAF